MATRATIYQANADRCRLAAEGAADLTARTTFLMLSDQWTSLAALVKRIDYFDGPTVRRSTD